MSTPAEQLTVATGDDLLTPEALHTANGVLWLVPVPDTDRQTLDGATAEQIAAAGFHVLEAAGSHEPVRAPNERLRVAFDHNAGGWTIQPVDHPEPRVVATIKAVQGRTWDRTSEAWTLPAGTPAQIVHTAASPAPLTKVTPGDEWAALWLGLTAAVRHRANPTARIARAGVSAIRPASIVPILTVYDRRLAITQGASAETTVRDLVRDIDPAAQWSQPASLWLLPAERRVLDAALGRGVPIDTAAHELVADVVRGQRDRTVASRAAGIADLDPATVTAGDLAELDAFKTRLDLYGYQEAGALVLARQMDGRALLCDKRGFGKTRASIAAARLLGARRVLVVTLSIVKEAWRWQADAGLDLTSDETRTVVLDGETPDPTVLAPERGCAVINYELLGAWQLTLQRWRPDLIIFDEGQMVKTPKADRSKVALALAKQARWRLVLTGTPILNKPAELIVLLRLVGRLHEFGDWRGFVVRYCSAEQQIVGWEWEDDPEQPGKKRKKPKYAWNTSGSSNRAELARLLRSTCMVRRTESAERPDKPIIVHERVPLDQAALAEYERARDETVQFLVDRAISAARAAGREPGPAAIAAAVAAERAEHLVRLNALRELAELGKVPVAIDRTQRLLDADAEQKVLVFCWSQKAAELIASRFNAPKIVGSTTRKRRDKIIDQFQTDPALRVLVATIAAAGTGVTLTAASQTVCTGRGWTPASDDQTEGRTDRIGQTKIPTITWLIADGTVDEDVHALIMSKADVAAGALGDVDDPDGSSPDVDLWVDEGKLDERRAASTQVGVMVRLAMARIAPDVPADMIDAAAFGLEGFDIDQPLPSRLFEPRS